MITANELYREMMSKIGEVKVSPFIDAKSVMCAIVTDKDTVYYGANIQAGCGLSVCAEKMAVSNAIIAGDTNFKYILCVFKDGSIITPCGSCRELLAQTGKQNLDMEIITSLNPFTTVKLSSMMSNWWGSYRY